MNGSLCSLCILDTLLLLCAHLCLALLSIGFFFLRLDLFDVYTQPSSVPVQLYAPYLLSSFACLLSKISPFMFILSSFEASLFGIAFH